MFRDQWVQTMIDVKIFNIDSNLVVTELYTFIISY